jgi:hypothetical protein
LLLLGRHSPLQVLKTAVRLLHAIVDILSSKNHLAACLLAMEMCQMVAQGMYAKDPLLMQVPGISRALAEKCERQSVLLPYLLHLKLSLISGGNRCGGCRVHVLVCNGNKDGAMLSDSCVESHQLEMELMTNWRVHQRLRTQQQLYRCYIALMLALSFTILSKPCRRRGCCGSRGNAGC